MEVLNIEYSTFLDEHVILTILLFIGVVGGLSTGLAFISTKISVFSFLLCLHCFIFIWYLGNLPSENIKYKEVIFNNSSSINEDFLTQYEILEIRGKIYQIKERENK